MAEDLPSEHSRPEPILQKTQDEESTLSFTPSKQAEQFELRTDPLSERKALVLQSFVRGFLEKQHQMDECTRKDAVICLQRVVRNILLSPKKNGSTSKTETSLQSKTDDQAPQAEAPETSNMSTHGIDVLSATISFPANLESLEDDMSDEVVEVELLDLPVTAATENPLVIENPFDPFVLSSPGLRPGLEDDQPCEQPGSGSVSVTEQSIVSVKNDAAVEPWQKVDCLLDESKSASILQGWAREISARKEKKEQFPLSAAVSLQSAIRSRMAKGQLSILRDEKQKQLESTVISLQSRVRRKLVQRQMSREKSAALEIQTAMRSSFFSDEPMEDTPKAISPTAAEDKSVPDFANQILDPSKLEDVPSDESVTTWSEGASVATKQIYPPLDKSGNTFNSSLKIIQLVLVVVAVLMGILVSNPPSCSPVSEGLIFEGTFESSWWTSGNAVKSLATSVCRSRHVRLFVLKKSKKLHLEAISDDGETLLRVKGDAVELTPDGLIVSRGRKTETISVPW